MSKRRKKTVKDEKSNVSYVNLEIDYDKLAKAIVQAQAESEQLKEKNEKAENEKLVQRRKEILHEKDYSHVRCCVLRYVRTKLNECRVLFGMLFISKKNARYFAGVTPLIKILTLALLGIIKWSFYGLVATCIYGAYKTLGSFNMLTWLMGGFCFFMLARMIRIAGFEIDNMEDGVALMNTATLVMTVFTVVFAAVSTISSMTCKG